MSFLKFLQIINKLFNRNFSVSKLFPNFGFQKLILRPQKKELIPQISPNQANKSINLLKIQLLVAPNDTLYIGKQILYHLKLPLILALCYPYSIFLYLLHITLDDIHQLDKLIVRYDCYEFVLHILIGARSLFDIVSQLYFLVL